MLTRFFRLAGALTVKCTGSVGGQEIRHGLDLSIIRKTFDALKNNWVITFLEGIKKGICTG